jgi:hypothetical protein
MYKLTIIIMWYAPLGVFSLIATTVAKQGTQVLLPFILLATLASHRHGGGPGRRSDYAGHGASRRGLAT